MPFRIRMGLPEQAQAGGTRGPEIAPEGPRLENHDHPGAGCSSAPACQKGLFLEDEPDFAHFRMLVPCPGLQSVERQGTHSPNARTPY